MIFSMRQIYWSGGEYFGLPITKSVVQFPFRTSSYKLASSYIEMWRQSVFLNHRRQSNVCRERQYVVLALITQ